MEDRLQKFARLVEYGTFTKAASELHISQPALSTAIKKLERELKQTLLVRGAHQVKLTPAGECAYATAKELRVSTSNLTLMLHQLAQQKPYVAIGMVDSIATALFTNTNAFTELEPLAHVSLVVNNSRYLTEVTQRNELDMAFVVEPSDITATRQLQTTLVGTEPLVIVCHRDHYAVVQDGIRRGELSPFVSYDRPSNTYRLIASTLAQAGIQVRPTFYSTSTQLMLQLVAANRGAAVLPYLEAKQLLEQRLIVPVQIGGSCVIPRRIHLIRQSGKELPTFLTIATRQVTATLQHLQVEASQIDK
jgi:DNA-binding transcriptional LysR family regulator